jgi:hypothetical protein
MAFSKCPVVAPQDHRIRNGISPIIPAPQSPPGWVTKMGFVLFGQLTRRNPLKNKTLGLKNGRCVNSIIGALFFRFNIGTIESLSGVNAALLCPFMR